MFEITVKTGEAGDVILRGCPDGCVEFCFWTEKTTKDKDTGESITKPYLEPYKYFACPEQAFNKIARMRISSANATTLKELVEAIKQIRQDIKQEMGVLI